MLTKGIQVRITNILNRRYFDFVHLKYPLVESRYNKHNEHRHFISRLVKINIFLVETIRARWNFNFQMRTGVQLQELTKFAC